MRQRDISKLLKVARFQNTNQKAASDCIENKLDLVITHDNSDVADIRCETMTPESAQYGSSPSPVNRYKNRHVDLNNEVIVNNDGTKSVVLKDDLDKVFALYELKNNIPTFTAITENPVFHVEKRHRLLNYTVSAIAFSDSVIGRSKHNTQIAFESTGRDNSFTSTLRQIISYTNRNGEYSAKLLNHVKEIDCPRELTKHDLKTHLHALDFHSKKPYAHKI